MYHIREVVLKNKKQSKKRLVIEFVDPDMAIVGEFLIADASIDGWSVLRKLDEVLEGKVPTRHVTGNRCGLDITQETTSVYDLLPRRNDVCTYASYTIETATLRKLVIMWRERMNAPG